MIYNVSFNHETLKWEVKSREGDWKGQPMMFPQNEMWRAFQMARELQEQYDVQMAIAMR